MRYVWFIVVVKERSLFFSRNLFFDFELRFLVDLFKFDNRILLVVSNDYYNYVEFVCFYIVMF